MKSFSLTEQISIPALGFGTWQIQGDACRKAVAHALETGYRHIDTADAYGNHMEVAKAIKHSGIKREDLFITTKVWQSNLSKGGVEESGKRFLEELDIDYIDLLLIHWPSKDVPLEETLEALNHLKKEKIIRAIGVSNFTIHHLQDVLETGIEVTNNQVELHPTFNQNELKTFCDDNGIIVTAYSPMGRGTDLDLPVITHLAQKYNRSPSQIILNWIVGRGIVAIPKATHPHHIEENFQALEFELTEEDMQSISGIPQKPRILNPAFGSFDY